ncbi:myoD family inhibitor domain-containing protein [Ambystoma mexicanum]|uniref:myoD family inhibitor domain-containing protein n=1 Tax=Ambystoma mexicanum TaxID=8296 RepID=UPI0037E7E38B
MSQASVPLPPGPEGPAAHPAAGEDSPLIPRSLEQCEKENTSLRAREFEQPSMNRSTPPETYGQPVWGDLNYGGLVKTQPQRLPQPKASVLEQSTEETSPMQNGHAGLSNGIQNGGTHVASDHRKLSAPVCQKMHRKLQASLSVSSDGSRKSNTSSTYSQKPGASPEDCCVHCILACLFCEFITLCNLVLGQASCGVCTSEVCCCCCGEEMGDDCNCPCDMDCGIMDACCESSDCLEICMECCGICFPS